MTDQDKYAGLRYRVTYSNEHGESWQTFRVNEVEDIIADHDRLVAENERLLKASLGVLEGLNARINAADPRSVPVFHGIAELHDALAAIGGE